MELATSFHRTPIGYGTCLIAASCFRQRQREKRNAYGKVYSLRDNNIQAVLLQPMSNTVSCLNLFLLLIFSICHLILYVMYHDQCPLSPFLALTLGIAGLLGVILSVTVAICYCCTAHDGSSHYRLGVMYILLVYLVISRIVVSVMAFRLASRSPDARQCSPVLYWSSTLLIVMSYSVIIITSCLLVKLLLLRSGRLYYPRSSDVGLTTMQL